jgi:uncharacterized damage-inducible protein DinB
VDETTVDDHGRSEPPLEGGEAATLLGFLDFQRGTLRWKCDALGDEQLQKALPPTSMTLGGLLKHLALVEDYWFTEVVAEAPMPEPWASIDSEADPDWEWRTASADSGDELRAQWEESVERSRGSVASQLEESGEAALSTSHPAWGGAGRVSLRWVLTHMIEEYARHNGHADLIRESIDGETGE